MCGRYAVYSSPDQFASVLPVEVRIEGEFFPQYNAAPGMALPVVYQQDPGAALILTPMHWGFVPHWSRGDLKPMINARAETAATKPSFRDAFKRRRCLVPADGFYEWTTAADGKKDPHYITTKAPIMFAGLWEVNPEGEPGYCILTQEACGEVATLHNRMPVVVPLGYYKQWLSPAPRQLSHQQAVLACSMAVPWEHWLVSRKVGRVDAQGEALIHAR